MDAQTTITSKGQVTVPKAVREALGFETGDRLHVHVEHDRAIISKTPDFLDLAGSAKVPPQVKGLPWREVKRKAWTERARRRA